MLIICKLFIIRLIQSIVYFLNKENIGLGITDLSVLMKKILTEI
jgi:hypothetical protein